ncbi:hypothetical protein WG66_003244, partial [Moniliophthora roreri]
MFRRSFLTSAFLWRFFAWDAGRNCRDPGNRMHQLESSLQHKPTLDEVEPDCPKWEVLSITKGSWKTTTLLLINLGRNAILSWYHSDSHWRKSSSSYSVFTEEIQKPTESTATTARDIRVPELTLTVLFGFHCLRSSSTPAGSLGTITKRDNSESPERLLGGVFGALTDTCCGDGVTLE